MISLLPSVKRDDHDFLLNVRIVEFEFDDLMLMIEEKIEQIKIAYEICITRSTDIKKAEKLLVTIRMGFHQSI